MLVASHCCSNVDGGEKVRGDLEEPDVVLSHAWVQRRLSLSPTAAAPRYFVVPDAASLVVGIVVKLPVLTSYTPTLFWLLGAKYTLSPGAASCRSTTVLLSPGCGLPSGCDCREEVSANIQHTDVDVSARWREDDAVAHGRRGNVLVTNGGMRRPRLLEL